MTDDRVIVPGLPPLPGPREMVRRFDTALTEPIVANLDTAALLDTLAAMSGVPEELVWADDIDMAIDHMTLGQARAHGWCAP